MELFDALKKRRSCRSFTEQSVTDEQVSRMLEALAWAPSPLNQQPWSVILVKDPARKSRMRKVAQSARSAVVDGGGPGWAGKYGMALLEEAPLLICVACDPAKGGLGTFFSQPLGAYAAACAGIQNLMLAATEMGLSTVWFTFYDPKAMAEVIDLAGNLELVGVLPMGVAGQEGKAPPRKTIEPVYL